MHIVKSDRSSEQKYTQASRSSEDWKATSRFSLPVRPWFHAGLLPVTFDNCSDSSGYLSFETEKARR